MLVLIPGFHQLKSPESIPQSVQSSIFYSKKKGLCLVKSTKNSCRMSVEAVKIPVSDLGSRTHCSDQGSSCCMHSPRTIARPGMNLGTSATFTGIVTGWSLARKLETWKSSGSFRKPRISYGASSDVISIPIRGCRPRNNSHLSIQRGTSDTKSFYTKENSTDFWGMDGSYLATVILKHQFSPVLNMKKIRGIAVMNGASLIVAR